MTALIRNIMQAKIEGKTDKEMPECWNLQFLEKFSANNFVLSDAEKQLRGIK